MAAAHTIAVKNDIEMDNDFMMLSLVGHVTTDFQASPWVVNFNRAITTSDLMKSKRHNEYETGFRKLSPNDVLLFC